MESASESNRRVHVQIRGRVQGVFYRASAAAEATRLGLTGWVRNLPDGCVEAVAEGAASRVEDFVAWCSRGPDRAWVESVDARWSDPTGEYGAFAVRL